MSTRTSRILGTAALLASPALLSACDAGYGVDDSSQLFPPNEAGDFCAPSQVTASLIQPAAYGGPHFQEDNIVYTMHSNGSCGTIEYAVEVSYADFTSPIATWQSIFGITPFPADVSGRREIDVDWLDGGRLTDVDVVDLTYQFRVLVTDPATGAAVPILSRAFQVAPHIPGYGN